MRAVLGLTRVRVTRRVLAPAAFAAVTAALLSMSMIGAFARPASAQALACDAGVTCIDSDGDGFLPCSCAPPGTRCDCDDKDPTTFPGAPEACDSPKEKNCNGAVDPCAASKGCLGSVCVPKCIPLDDFGCTTGSTFANQPNGTCLCAPEDCSLFGCPPGFTCDDAKACVANCHPGVRCPAGQRCRGFGCVDACIGVYCASGETCVDGLCVSSCACAGSSSACAPGQTCDRTAATPACIDEACRGVVCAAGSRCEHGACVDDCKDVVCPPKLVCRSLADAGTTRAECSDLCAMNTCPFEKACEWRTGECVPRPIREGGLLPKEIPEELFVSGAGFTCTSSGALGGSALTLCTTATTATTAGVAGVALVLGLRRRRRRRRRQ